MSVDASTLAPNFLTLEMAIVTCCEDIIANELAMNAELGAGIAAAGTAWSTAWTACCNAEIAADMVVIPPTTTTAPDGTVTVTGGYTGPWEGYWAFSNQNAQDNQTAAQSGAYQDYLADLEAWRNAQILPLLLSLAANLILVNEQLELYNDMLDCTIDLLDCVKEETAELKGLSINTLIPAVAAHTDTLMAKFTSAGALQAICDQREGIVARSDSMWACFENVFKPELTQYYADFMGEMFSHGAAGSEQQIELRDLNRQLQACFNDYIKNEDSETAPVIGAAIRQMSNKLDDACDWLTECAEKIETHWDTTRAEQDANYAQAASDAAIAALNGTQEINTFLTGCRDAWKAIQETVYHVNESVHVPALQQAAIDTLGNMTEVSDCALECAQDEKARYALTYEAKEDALSKLAMNEACNLHPCFGEIVDCLKTLSDDAENCWQLWKPKETQYLCDFIEKATEKLCEVEEDLEAHCAKLLTFCDHWERCYKEAECQVAPKIISAAQLACEKQESTYLKICSHMDHLWDKFDSTWCPWDEQDARHFCDFWMKTNPLDELCDNHECQQDMADLLKDCYQDLVLPWEKEYIREICNMDKYTAKYCETESSAIALIRAQSQREAERAIKSNPRYCSGASKQQQINIHNQRIRLEAAAMQSANRDERWWETQECDRRHRYTMDVLERLGKRFPDHALQFYGGSTEILDNILIRMHERLVRGYEYVRNTNDYARTTLNANQAAVEASARMIQLGQAYPDLYVRGKQQQIQSDLQFLTIGQDAMRQGQFYPTLAGQNKERAANVVNQSAQWGFQHMQHGQQHLRTALDAKRISGDTANQLQGNALRSYAIGQDYLRLAVAAQQEVTSQMNSSIGAANTMATTGVQYANLAADKMDSVLQGALDAIRSGNQMMSNNRAFAGQIQQGYGAVVTNGINAYDQFLRSYRVGLDQVQIAQGMDQVSLGAALDSMSSVCDFLSRNHCCTAQTASQSNGGALDTATGLLSGAAQGIQSGFNGAIGSLTALNTPPVPPTIFGNTVNTTGTPSSGNPASIF